VAGLGSEGYGGYGGFLSGLSIAVFVQYPPVSIPQISRGSPQSTLGTYVRFFHV
jgi:hypothetical protein